MPDRASGLQAGGMPTADTRVTGGTATVNGELWAPFRLASGAYRLENEFRYLLAAA